MIVGRYDPINLFEELVPKLNFEMEPELASSIGCSMMMPSSRR